MTFDVIIAGFLETLKGSLHIRGYEKMININDAFAFSFK